MYIYTYTYVRVCTYVLACVFVSECVCVGTGKMGTVNTAKVQVKDIYFI